MTPELIDALTLLAQQVQLLALQAGGVFARIGPVFALVPVFGERVIPARIRLAGALAMTAIVAPAVPEVPPPLAPVALVLFLGAETMIGVILGMALRLMVMALQIAGTIAAQATSLAQAFGGAGVDPQPAIAQLLVMGGLALAVLSGFAERLALFLVLSYDIFPPGAWPDAAEVARWGTGRVAQAFGLAFSLAAPFVLAASLYNLALGAINRAMPQLMVAFIGAPALTLGGLALLLLAGPLMLGSWLPGLHALLGDPATP